MKKIITSALESRRRQLGMGLETLARLSGVSMPTVHRILSGGIANAQVKNVAAIARALRMELVFDPQRDSGSPQFRPVRHANDILREAARAKAERLVAMVQATSGLESQAVDSATKDRMIEQTEWKLLAGSRRRVWSP
jgi:transcriptional regulator with XRE-family HTH domain